MKLFGNRRHAEHAAPSGHGRLNGWQIGAIVLAATVCILAAVGFGVYRAMVRPVRRTPEQQQNPVIVTPTETVKKPTVVVPQIQVDEQTGQEEQVEVEVPASCREGVYNVLICGTDGDGIRTDTIIIAHLDINTGETALLSIPRDTIVPKADGGLMKINSVYNGGKEAGMERLETRLAAMVGFEMDGYVLVDLEAFQKTVELVGGVWFDVPQDMYYSDPSQDLHIDLKQGYQLLDGKAAMGLVRYRKGYASQDIQRTQVQQDFLKALAKQCVKIGNLTKLQEFAEIFTTYVTTDMTVGNLLYYAQELMQCDLDQMQSYTAQGEGMTIGGVSYYPLYSGSLLTVVNEAFNPYETEILPDNISLITPETAKSYQKPAAPEPEVPEEPDEPNEPPAEEPEDAAPPEEELPDSAWEDEWPDGGWQDDSWKDVWPDENGFEQPGWTEPG